MSQSEIIEIKESPYLGAFGACLFASEASAVSESANFIYHEDNTFNETLSPLYEFEHLLDFKAADVEERFHKIRAIHIYSRWTRAQPPPKAILLNASDLSIGASCYLRTLGNPVQAASNCLNDLIEQVAGQGY